MRSARRSTIPISSSPPSSATAKPRPRRSRARGRARASSIRRATARCCRFCISTATRSADPPCSRARTTHDVVELLEAHGYDVSRRRGRRSDAGAPATGERARRHARRAFARSSRRAQRPAPATLTARPRWPAIVLRTPKGWTGPRVVDGHPVEGTFRVTSGSACAHARPMPAQLAMLEDVAAQLRAGHAVRRARRVRRRPRGARAEGRSADGREPARERRTTARAARSPRFRDYAVDVPQPATRASRIDAAARRAWCATCSRATRGAATSASSAPTKRTRIGSRACSTSRTAVSSAVASTVDDHVAPDGRVMEVLSEHLCEGWLEGYLLTGRHGMFVTYESFAMVSASMTVQHTKWLQEAIAAAVARAGRVAEHRCSRPPAGATTTTDSAIRVPG